MDAALKLRDESIATQDSGSLKKSLRLLADVDFAGAMSQHPAGSRFSIDMSN